MEFFAFMFHLYHPVQCEQARVVRVREGLSGKLFPTYHLCIRNGPGADETILLAAQKQTGKRSFSSYYLITLDPRCFQKGASTYVAKLRANWAGTEYFSFITTHSFAVIFPANSNDNSVFRRS